MEIQRERFVLGDPFLVLAQILLGIIDLLWVNDELQPGGNKVRRHKSMDKGRKQHTVACTLNGPFFG